MIAVMFVLFFLCKQSVVLLSSLYQTHHKQALLIGIALMGKGHIDVSTQQRYGERQHTDIDCC